MESKEFSRCWFQIFVIFTPTWEDSQFDEHIFQMGWFNHQPVFFLMAQLRPG